MRIVKIDRENRVIEVVPESMDDLWHLGKIIETGDLVSGRSERKIKPKKEGEKPFRAEIFVKIDAEKVEFHRHSGELRVGGIVVEASPAELVGEREHHTLEIKEGRKVCIGKKEIKKWHVDRLEKAKAAGGREKLVLVVLDDEVADIALLKDFGFEDKAKIMAAKGGKQYAGENGEEGYFKEILKKVKELKAEKVIFAGPGFTRNNIENYIRDKKLKIGDLFFESTNSVGITGINELLKSGKVDRIVENLQLSKETALVERVFEQVGKGGAVAYGWGRGEDAVRKGAVEQLIISEETMLEDRERAEKIMDLVEKVKGETHIISGEHEGVRRLKGIGGVAALLRYKID